MNCSRNANIYTADLWLKSSWIFFHFGARQSPNSPRQNSSPCHVLRGQPLHCFLVLENPLLLLLDSGNGGRQQSGWQNMVCQLSYLYTKLSLEIKLFFFGAVVQVPYTTNPGSVVFAVKHLKGIKLPVPWNNAVSTCGTNPDKSAVSHLDGVIL